jgi:ABC-type transport system involved in cytochrome bd biosynthesis fused ATPase/permease subunit
MNIYEEMWKLFVNRIVLAKTHSLEQDVKYDTIIELLRLIETSNHELIEQYQKEKQDKEIKEKTGMTPVQ